MRCIMGDVQVAYCFSFAFAADNCGSIQSHLWRNVADSFCPTLPTLPFPKGGLSMQVSSQISLFHWIRFQCDGTCQWPLQGWFPPAGLIWIPPSYTWGILDPTPPYQPLRHQFPSSSISDEFNCWYVYLLICLFSVRPRKWRSRERFLWTQ